MAKCKSIGGHGKAVQVDISLTPRVESARFQLLESKVLSSRSVFQIVLNPHPYSSA